METVAPDSKVESAQRIDCRMPWVRAKHMAGMKGRSGPPGNLNNFQHGLAALQKRRGQGAITESEENIKAEILAGLIADKGGEAQISTQCACWERLSPAMCRC